jgi:hypothetical protein
MMSAFFATNSYIFKSACLQLLTAAMLISGVAVGAVVLNRIEIRVSRSLSHHYGWKSMLITGWLGTGIHELSHLACCKVLGLRVVDFKLYKPDTRTGTLGYVYFVQDKRGLLGAVKRSMVGTAPLFFGLCLLTLGVIWVGWRPEKVNADFYPRDVPAFVTSFIQQTSLGLMRLISGKYVWDVKFWIWSYVALSVGLHMSPSRADMKNTKWGLTFFFVIIAVALFSFQLVSRNPSPKILNWAMVISVAASVTLFWSLLLGAVYFFAVKLITRLLP